MYCKKCGSYLDDTASKCPVCGAGVEQNNVQADYSAECEWEQAADSDNVNLQTEQPVKVTDWMLTLIISSIPFLNIIMMFVWAFGSGVAASKRNWARAMLIFMGISAVFSVVAFVLFMILAASQSHATTSIWPQ